MKLDTISYEEFLKIQEESDERLEYYFGEVVALARPRIKHQAVSFNLSVVLGNYLKGKTCRPFCEVDCNLFEDNSVIVSPDLVVVCDPDKIGETQISGAPDLVVEILSPSTKGRDLLEKRHYYQKAGVKEYWIIDPDAEFVEVITFNDNHLSSTIIQYSQEHQQKPTTVSKVLEDFMLDLTDLFK